MSDVSKRAESIRPFIVMDVVARARELEASGRDIVHLEIGDPDFTTPEVIVKAAEAAMDAGETGYTPSLGLPDLRDAVAYRARDDYGVDIAPGGDPITLSVGFDDLAQPGWGRQVPWTPEQAWTLRWLVNGSDFDFCVDDVEFF